MVERLSIYKCEACGKPYEDANEAHECEANCLNLIEIFILADKRMPGHFKMEVDVRHDITKKEVLDIVELARKQLILDMEAEAEAEKQMIQGQKVDPQQNEKPQE